ncbi:MAG: succinate dehydrogenase assembly factor 2 [Bacillota bacterium]
MDERAIERLKWRSRRGLLELDLVFERFWRRGGSGLAQEEVAAFERMLSMPDNDLLDLVMGRSQSSDPQIRSLVDKLRTA